MSETQPLISIIIVNWNGKKWLKKCLDSLCRQTYKNIEIIFVDNASTDDSVTFVTEHYPTVITVKNDTNRGFSGGNNVGINQAKGEYILLLNNDTWVKDDFVEKLYASLEKERVDVLAPLEAHYDGTMQDAYIMLIDFFGHGFGMHNTNRKPFYLPGVCLLFSKKLYEETGGLDSDFFMYSEEVDWFWRLRLFGKAISQSKDIIVYHAGAGTIGKGIRYTTFLWRNQNVLQMLLKNYAWYNLIWTLPLYFLQNIFEIFILLIFLKPKLAWSYVDGWVFNIRYLYRTMKKRKDIQKMRLVSDYAVMETMYFGFGKAYHLLQRFLSR
jgi:GT2 family glycosyltransferase